MTEELKDEMKKLKEELKELKEQLKTEPKIKQGTGRAGIYIDIGEAMRAGEYVQDVIEGVAEGIQGELEKSIFVGPRTARRAIKIHGPR
ncbi:MAG: hypothetical protein JSV35_04350, partial [Candidatus Bathyarchaeota archaeon]